MFLEDKVKTISGYENYAVTKDGRVWSHRHSMFLKPSVISGGYLAVNLCENGKRRMHTIHRLILNAFVGLWKVMPVLAGLTLILTLSSMGLPGLNGFVGIQVWGTGLVQNLQSKEPINLV